MHQSAGSLGWPFQLLKYKCIFQIKYTEGILSNSTRKLLCSEITKMLIAVLKNKFMVSFTIIFRTLLFPKKSENYKSNKTRLQITAAVPSAEVIRCQNMTVTISGRWNSTSMEPSKV